MPYEVLARKWRPQVFDDVVGQEHVTQTLVNAIKTDRLAHAYLFGGPRGVGKTSVARILAKAINCEEGSPGMPCNSCTSCLEITDGSSVDVQEIDGASNRGIDEIRDLRENIKYMPSSNRYRVYIIDEVHMLTLPAFNALLKTLEEPPAHVKFIFATTEAHKVPVTILSRCQRFDFKRIPMARMLDHLETITNSEGIEISKPSLALIAREAEGSMRDAQSLLDQVISFTGPSVEDRHVIEILGIIDRDILFKASRAMIESAPQECLEIVDQIYNFGYDIKEFYRALMNQFRNLLISLIANQNHLLDMTENEKQETRQQAEQAGDEKLQAILNFLIRREKDLRLTSFPRLILEMTMIRACTLGDFLSFGALLDRIDALEKRLTEKSTHIRVEKPANPIIAGATQLAEKTDRPQETGEKTSLTWEDFLHGLSTKNIPMYNILKNWHYLGLTEKTLEIAKGHQSFSSSYFEDKGQYDQLCRYCQEYFGRKLKVNIVENSVAKPQIKEGSVPESPNRAFPENTDYPEPVKDVLQMFQGEVKKERPSKEMKPKRESIE